MQRRIIPKNDCPWIYHSVTIMSNGDVVPCCHDACGNEIMGNLIKQDLEDVWNGEKFQNFRNRIHTNQKDIEICRLCSGYGVSDIK